MYEHAMEEAFQAVGPVERKHTLKTNLSKLLGDFTYLDECDTARASRNRSKKV